MGKKSELMGSDADELDEMAWHGMWGPENLRSGDRCDHQSIWDRALQDGACSS